MRSAMLASQMLVWCRRGGVSRARLGSIQAWRVEAAESECCRQERLQATAKDVATRCMHEEGIEYEPLHFCFPPANALAMQYSRQSL